MKFTKKIGVIGVGKLGEAIIAGLLKTDNSIVNNIIGSVNHLESIERVKKKFAIPISQNNTDLVSQCDILIIAVKPQNMDSLLKEISPYITKDKLIISVAASVTINYITQRLEVPISIIRAMPNTPCVINQGMTAICASANCNQEDLNLANEIFKCIGETVFIDEYLMDGVTALSASGPAYLYVIIESLAEAGVKLGISRDISTLLAAQTMLGAASMVLNSKSHPALLKDMVTTPAGCTIDGLMELEEGKLRVTLIKAVVKAAIRAKELVNN